MVKRIFFAWMVAVLLLPFGQAFAANSYNLWSMYDSVKDNYMVAYYKQIPDRPSSFVVTYVNPANAAANAQKTFYGSDVSGIFYLTCNGQYNFDFYDTGGVLSGSSQLITTTQVSNNLCESYASPVDQYEDSPIPQNDNDVYIDKENGVPNIYWDPGSCIGHPPIYSIYRDGVLFEILEPGRNLFQYPIQGDGLWRVETTYLDEDCHPDVGEVYYQDGPGDSDDPWLGEPAPGDGSSPDGPIVPPTPPDPNAPVTNGSLDAILGGALDEALGEALGECGTQICECIAQLKPSLDAINTATNGVLAKITNDLSPTLQQIEDNTGGMLAKLTDQLQITGQIHTVLGDIRDELRTDESFPIKTADFYPPIQLEDNKPLMHEEVFTDDTVYFEDQGDNASPPPFPGVPEPVEVWKDINGADVVKEPAKTADPKMEKQPVMEKQPILVKDPNLQKDPALVKEPNLQRQPSLVQDQIAARDAPLVKDNTQYLPRLRMRDGEVVP